MASETKTENVMLTGQSAYFKKNGSMTNHGTIELENALSSHSYSEGYIGPNSILHGTDLATTEEYTQCESVMKNYLGENWEETEDERTIITNSNKIKSMLLPEENNMQKLYDDIAFDGTELEYIQGTGTQYITTDYIPNVNSRIELVYGDATAYSTSTTAVVLSASTVLSNTYRYLLGVFSSAFAWSGTSSSTHVAFGSSSRSGKHTLSIHNNIIVLDGETVLNNSSTTFNNLTYLSLWGCTANLSSEYLGRFKLYSCKIYEGDTIVRDFIPCKDIDGVVCLYEKITKSYFYSKGSGMFTAGPQLDSKHTELEYIETDGTQRIDLNLTAKSNSGFYIDFMPLEDFETTTSTGSKCIIAAGGNDTRYISTRYAYINICSRPDYSKGSIQIGRGTTPLDAKLVQYQRTQIELKNNILTLGDGTKITTSQGSPNSSVKWRLFNFYSSMGSISAKSKVRFYGCKIYEGDEIVADIIPAKDKFNIGCVYDKITDRLLYADINSEDIKLGPVKNN